ncbi:MAG: hypothetical protein WDN72_09230 [Alphaproteobacteria bacterium]
MVFRDRIASPNEKKTEIHLIRGKSTEGEPTYTYLAIYTHRVRDLKLSLLQKTTDLEDYGVIVASGFGEPDEATQAYIRTAYLT